MLYRWNAWLARVPKRIASLSAIPLAAIDEANLALGHLLPPVSRCKVLEIGSGGLHADAIYLVYRAQIIERAGCETKLWQKAIH